MDSSDSDISNSYDFSEDFGTDSERVYGSNTENDDDSDYLVDNQGM